MASWCDRLRQRPHPVERVLDLGCGDGQRLASLLEAFPAASGIAIDHAFDRLAQATDRLAPYRGRVAVQGGDLRTPDFWRVVPGPVDVVLAGRALRTLQVARTKTLYSEIFLGLSPGGTLLAIDATTGSDDVDQHLAWLRALGFAEVDGSPHPDAPAILEGHRPCSSS